MSDPILDPAKLVDIIKATGLVDAVQAMLKNLVAAAPLTDEQKASLSAGVDANVAAIVAHYGPELLAALKSQLVSDVVAAITTGVGPISNDQSGFA